MVSRLSRSVAPLYPIAEAARFARTHPQTLKRWAQGYEVAGREYATLLVLPDERPRGELLLSFENLIEAAIITAWRRRGIPLQRIRRAHVLAIAEFGEHPFARQDVYVEGRELFIRADEDVAENGRSFTQITAGGQRVFAPAVEDFLRSIDWRTGQETRTAGDHRKATTRSRSTPKSNTACLLFGACVPRRSCTASWHANRLRRSRTTSVSRWRP